MTKKRVSIRMGIFVSYSILILLAVSPVYACTLIASKKILITQIGRSRQDVLQQISIRTQLLTSSMMVLSNLLYTDENVQAAISGPPENAVQYSRESGDSIDRLVQKYWDAYSEIDIPFYVVVQGENGFNFCSDSQRNFPFEAVKKSLWYRTVSRSRGEVCWVNSYDDQFFKGEKNYVFSAARMFRDADTEENKGILIISIDERLLYEIYEIALNGDNFIFFVDNQGTIVTSPNQKMVTLNYYNMEVFSQLVDRNHFAIIKKGNEKYLLSNAYNDTTGLTVVEEIPLKVLLKTTNQLTYLTVIFTVFCLVLSFGLAYLMARQTMHPLNKLCRWMDRVRDGDLETRAGESRWAEIHLLNRRFNDMICRLNTLMKDVSEKEKSKRMAELSFLQAQINPHFIYNTLFSIKCMVSMNENAKAEQMMDTFIWLLREGIRGTSELVSIEQELDYLTHFLALLQFRYTERIEFQAPCREDIRHCFIPKMLLQPIIENAVCHGIRKGQDLLITMGFCKEKESLIISIADNGQGFDPLTLRSDEMAAETKKRFNKIGLANVRERIQLLFGSEYNLEIQSKPGCGTVVTIIIPWID